MNILIACEESQRVCTKFRAKGHNAFSCDIIDCSGGQSGKKGENSMKNERITLTGIEKEKLLCCVRLAAKNFELNHRAAEKELSDIEKRGGQDDHLLARLEHYRDRQSFFEALVQKVIQAFENNQI